MIVLDTIKPSDLTGPGKAKYKIVAAAIRSAIEAEALSPGQQLPPVRELAFQLEVTPGTIARSYSELTESGHLTAGVGRGTFVAERRAPAPAEPAGPVPSPSHFVPYEQPDDGPTAYLLSPRLPDVGQVAVMREGMTRLADDFTKNAFLRYPSRLTDEAARVMQAKMLQDAPVGPFDVEDVVVTNGGQNAILLVMQTILHGAEPVILVDELSYSGFLRAAELCRAKVVGVPWDEDGPDPEVFEALVRKHKPQIYGTSAEVSNPLVRTTAPKRRVQIAEIARQYGVHVLDDDCYRLQGHKGPGYRALLPELGWHLASPSKSISPALRIGFVIGPRAMTEDLKRTASFAFFSVSRLVTDLFAYVVSDPAMPDIERGMADWVGQQVRTTVNALGRYNVTWDPMVPFVWLDLPNGWRAGEFCQAAEAAGVLLKSAEDFALRDSRRVHGMRIAMNATLSPQRMNAALSSLCDLLDRPARQISV